MAGNIGRFTPEDLSLLVRAAVLAGATVSISSYSGGSGTDAEFRAITEGLAQAARHYPSNPLVQALATPEAKAEVDRLAPWHHGDTTQHAYEDFKMAALNRCADAAEVLADKATTAQADEVKQAILFMCEHVAEASKEGSRLGFGGTRVSPNETAAIEQIRRALGAGESQ
jgi:hypothetical protein